LPLDKRGINDNDARMDTVRMGTLGAARITPNALVKPAKEVGEVTLDAVAARDPSRARAFAAKHGIAKVHESYDTLLADPDIDAIYNPLPNGLHAVWTIKALEAGKHVLCEKPFTANAAEAEEVAAVGARTGLVCMEAFHYRYHPLAARMKEIVDGGELGTVRRIETWMCFPLPLFRDIRYQLHLAGGATMDAGCYAIHMLRFLAGAEPEVVSARALLAKPQVDRRMDAEFRFDDGRTGHITTSMWSRTALRMAAHVTGDKGTMKVFNPTAPQYFNRLTLRTAAGTTRERVRGDATYTYQLRAFADAVLRGTPFPTGPDDAIANMRVIDAVYRAAGLLPRGEAVAA
jgi:predicted dehydrogenase